VVNDNDDNEDDDARQSSHVCEEKKGIKAALELDFQKQDSNQKHPVRLESGDAVKISKSKMLTQMMWLQIVMMADAWRWESEKDTMKREQIVHAACRVVCYDHGYSTPSKGSNFVEWHLQLHDTVSATMEEIPCSHDQSRAQNLQSHHPARGSRSTMEQHCKSNEFLLQRPPSREKFHHSSPMDESNAHSLVVQR
jgi:hypothetical protein